MNEKSNAGRLQLNNNAALPGVSNTKEIAATITDSIKTIAFEKQLKNRS